jgi:polyisoprenyl-teichoic acid--peptidoglycan teichoic acid transferase
MTETEKTSAEGKPRAPRWARICAIFGAILMLLSGGVLIATEVLVARYASSVKTEDLFGDAAPGASPEVRRSELKGPLDILLVGIDPRQATTLPLADSIIIVHVSEDLKSAYLFSLARDLIVDIPAFPRNGYRGGRGRINSAMAEGSRVPGRARPDPARGFELLSRTVSQYTGIRRFDAGAIVNFDGFKKIVDAMGGVTMYVDERTRSEHLRPDGSPRTPNGRGAGYIGPQKTYEKGTQKLKGWEALDYVRQRYGLKGGDYARQRHQQQFLKAMVEQALSRDVVTNPIKLDKVLRAAGQSLIFNGRGHSVVDFGFGLKGVRPETMTMIKLPGYSVIINGEYRGERLESSAEDFFRAVRGGTIDEFLVDNPDFVSRTKS